MEQSNIFEQVFQAIFKNSFGFLFVLFGFFLIVMEGEPKRNLQNGIDTEVLAKANSFERQKIVSEQDIVFAKNQVVLKKEKQTKFRQKTKVVFSNEATAVSNSRSTYENLFAKK